MSLAQISIDYCCELSSILSCFPTPAPPVLRRLQFKLSTLLIITAIFAITIGLNSMPRSRSAEQLRAARTPVDSVLGGNLRTSNVEFRGWPLPYYAVYQDGYCGFDDWFFADAQPTPRYRFFLPWMLLANASFWAMGTWALFAVLAAVPSRWCRNWPRTNTDRHGRKWGNTNPR